MVDKTIECPNCGAEIELTEALTGQIERSVKAKYVAEAAKKEKQIAEKAEALKKQEEELRKRQQSIESQVDEKLKAERAKIADQKKNLEELQQQIDEQVAEKLRAQRKDIAEAERKKILADQAQQTKALQEELERKRKEVSEAKKKELDFLRKQRELEEQSEQLELEVERKISEERKKIAEEASKKAAEENMLKMREKDDLIKSMQGKIEDLKRKAETGSQERQGEALEEQLQEVLQQAFPFDKFEEIKKGARGADILQVVLNSSGKECGSILWESKNTKDFQKGWIEKLKNDQREANANLAVIMSVALPSKIESFGIYEDVWVTDYKSAIGLAMALRQSLINLKRSEIIQSNQSSLKDVIYNYITSQEFAMHIKAVVSAYKQMQEDLNSEKRSMQRIWKKRETQIQKVMGNVTDIYATIEGLVGSQKVLPAIEPLSLESIADDEY